MDIPEDDIKKFARRYLGLKTLHKLSDKDLEVIAKVTESAVLDAHEKVGKPIEAVNMAQMRLFNNEIEKLGTPMRAFTSVEEGRHAGYINEATEAACMVMIDMASEPTNSDIVTGGSPDLSGFM